MKIMCHSEGAKRLKNPAQSGETLRLAAQGDMQIGE